MRVFVLKRAVIIKVAVAIAIVASVIVGATVMIDAQPAAATAKTEPLTAVQTNEKAVALTFDTVFGEDQTETLLDILKDSNVKATFAVMGAWAKENPEAVKRIIADGHEIISHSMMHPRYTDISEDEVLKDATAAQELLKTDFGVETRYIRMPYGAYNDKTLAVLEKGGFMPVTWSIDSKDWKETDVSAVTANVTSQLKEGSIVMFQNDRTVTAEALEGIIASIKDSGYSCVTLSKLTGGEK